MSDKNIGIITEQGFPVNNTNLGFKPLTESEKEALEKSLEKVNDKNSK